MVFSKMRWQSVGLVFFFAVLGISFGWYTATLNNLGQSLWQVRHFDHADYRFIAEHFWRIPHDTSSYADDFSGDWGAYLSRIPFRDIGVGTFYLAIHSITELFSASCAASDTCFARVIPTILKISLGLSCLFFFLSVRKRYGGFVALLASIILLFPPSTWLLTDELLSEPLLRICFIIVVSLFVQRNPQKDSLLDICIVLFALLVAHLKLQWMLYGIGLGTLLLLSRTLQGKIWSSRTFFIVLLTICIPVSLSLVHKIGWDTYSLRAGFGVQINFQFHGEYYQWFCQQHPSMTSFCGKSVIRNGFYGIPMGNSVALDDLRSFDTEAMSYFLSHHADVIRMNLLNGIRYATVFPVGVFGNANFARSLPELILDLFSWIMLIIGLCHKRTTLLSAAVIGLWLVPVFGNIFAVYLTRYHRPMMGLPFAIAIIILADLLQSRGKRKMGHTTPKNTKNSVQQQAQPAKKKRPTKRQPAVDSSIPRAM